MFMMSPAAIKAKRKAERRDHERRRGHLGQNRFNALADELARVMRMAFTAGDTGSLFGLEGPLCHDIRADICLMGWRWHDADTMAKELVADALRRVRAVRPTWNEGQRKWTIQAGVLIERTRCVRRHNPLPEKTHKFCSRLWADAHGKRLEELRAAGEGAALKIAIRHVA